MHFREKPYIEKINVYKNLYAYYIINNFNFIPFLIQNNL